MVSSCQDWGRSLESGMFSALNHTYNWSKSTYQNATRGISKGLIAINAKVDEHHEDVKTFLSILKITTGIFLTIAAFCISPTLTLAFIAISLIHNLNLFPPTRHLVNLLKNIWDKTLGIEGQPNSDHEKRVLFGLGAASMLIAPTVVAPAIAGLIVGEKISDIILAIRV